MEKKDKKKTKKNSMTEARTMMIMMIIYVPKTKTMIKMLILYGSIEYSGSYAGYV